MADTPDLMFEDLEYVRVEDGNPIARIRADVANRYESRTAMEISGMQFEQLVERGEKTDAVGRAGKADINTNTNDLSLKEGVTIHSEKEDVTIQSSTLEWENESRQLHAGEDELVTIEKSDGTIVRGRGFKANARSRSWTFDTSIEGTYVHEDEDEDASEDKNAQP
jgi:LPS export ABC transporter protein LptC